MICEKKVCTGCFACFNACPKQAISMQEDEYGNIYPNVNKEKCINCNLCKKVCPQLKNIEYNTPISVYAMHLKDKNQRKESTSGGASAAIAMKIIKNGGVVYGASNLFGSESFNFVRIDEIDDLYKIKGSKYVHCYIGDKYKKVKEDLVKGRIVAFFGTPCQIFGLKCFLQKDFDNLVTIDIICHGVSSQKLLFDQIEQLGLKKEKVYGIYFRDEKNFNFKIIDENNKVVLEKPASEVPYYKNFLQGNIYRENCYNCKFAKLERVSDITLGDFWGLNKDSIVYDDESLGISAIIVNTIKGQKCFELIKDISLIDKRDLSEVQKSNKQLNCPMKKNWKHRVYVKKYPLLGFEQTFKKMVSIKQKIKKLVFKNVSNIKN